MPYKQVHRIADAHVPAFRDTYLASVNRVRRQITIPLVADDMQDGILDPPMRLFRLVDSIQIAKALPPADPEELRGVYAEILTQMAQATLATRFDVQSPLVQHAARTMTATLVRQVSDETKAALRLIIFESVRDGVAPRESARLIRSIIGLTRAQAGAVARLSETMKDLKDRDARVAQYGEKLLRGRAENIARTETMRASNQGQQLAWRQMQTDHLIDTSRFQQRWLVTPDDRLCERCAPMNGKRVPLGGKFESTEVGVLPSQRRRVVGEVVDAPPLHPR